MFETPKPFKKILSPSILAADHAALADGLKIVQESGLDWIHLDIMDGNFVPNISFGPGVVKALRSRDKKLFFDTHLMLVRPDKYIEKFADAGADLITIHVEPDYPKAETLLRIRALGKQAGISLNPDTPADTLLPYLDKVDLVLVMSVFPGFGGQKFIADVLPKIEQLAKWREERGGTWRIEVDGGVDTNTAPL
ncbi:MAG: ribulose-phosphate 3-epimerase, partial [Opitutales bacterium]|nr:ribulose-phosphate 3-epimerase [Opitutales bacterium]